MLRIARRKELFACPQPQTESDERAMDWLASNGRRRVKGKALRLHKPCLCLQLNTKSGENESRPKALVVTGCPLPVYVGTGERKRTRESC